ncbi:MAG: type II and III secretion system protein family protein [Sphingomonas sp.]
MRIRTFLHRSVAATVATALVAAPLTASAAPRKSRHVATRTMARVGTPPAGTQRPTREVLLSVGQGELITLPADVADVWTSNPAAADVYVNSARQIHLYGKAFGEATLFATSKSGAVIYAANIRVSQNLTSIDRMMKLAMPDNDIKVVTTGQIAVLTGTVATPDESAQAMRIATALLNPGVDTSSSTAALKIAVFNRLKTATPLQVNLQVKFAEVSRSFMKNIGNNLLTRDQTGGFNFGVSTGGRANPGTIGPVSTAGLPVLDASSKFGFPAGTISLPYDPRTGNFVYPGTGTATTFTKGSQFTTLGLAGHFLGLDLLSAIDLGETDGQVTTLANPNLTALSGETGTFLAGGEIPIPVSQGLGAVSIEYKQYGVSLAYTPTVLADGRISLRVRPEVSQLSSAGAVTIGGTTIPALTTRRAETTVELGSGQSFMIGGLLQNDHQNTIDKAPGLGDVPVLGALFRSNGFQRHETELVIIITPYLVKPVNANDIVLPTDGYKAPTDIDRILLGKLGGGTTGGDRPKPTMAPPANAGPTFGEAAPMPGAAGPVLGAAAPMLPARAPDQSPVRREVSDQKAPPPEQKSTKGKALAMPGFSSN